MEKLQTRAAFQTPLGRLHEFGRSAGYGRQTTLAFFCKSNCSFGSPTSALAVASPQLGSVKRCSSEKLDFTTWVRSREKPQTRCASETVGPAERRRRGATPRVRKRRQNIGEEVGTNTELPRADSERHNSWPSRLLKALETAQTLHGNSTPRERAPSGSAPAREERSAFTAHATQGSEPFPRKASKLRPH